MTSGWVPLVVAVAGLAGTLSGVWLTQRRADRREKEAWDRERQRERERWTREDAARTFEHRRDAYVEFYESLRAMAFVAYNHGMGLRGEEELGEWQLPSFRRLQHLQLYASSAVADAAGDAYSAVWRWGNETRFGEDDDGFYERQERYDQAEVKLLAAIRRDLSIPDEPLGPGADPTT